MERCISLYHSNIKNLATHKFDEQPFFKLEGEIVDSGFDALPPKGYELPKKFPNCCKWHTSLLTSHSEWFNSFPNCCEPHKELSQRIWFKKEAFHGLPLKIVKNIAFTSQHIHEQAQKENGLEDIIYYIEYMLESFGTPGIGASSYISNLKYYLLHVKQPFALKETKNLLINYLAQLQSNESLSSVDPNLVYSVFQKWLNALPDLSIFSAFKQAYQGKIAADFLFHEASHNPYSGRTSFRIRTRKQLVKHLLEFTRDALASVDSFLLLENGTISSVAKHQLDIVGGKRKIKQEALLGKYTKGELKYLDVMQQWLVNEEEYFTSVASLLGDPAILPNVQRPPSLVAGIVSPIQNHISLGDNANIYMAQGNNIEQTNELSSRNLMNDELAPPAI